MHCVMMGTTPCQAVVCRTQVINERLASSNLTDAELHMAKEPGLSGRIWHGQGMVFDEGYGILMLLGILTDPKQASGVSHRVRVAGGHVISVHTEWTHNFALSTGVLSDCRSDVVCAPVSRQLLIVLCLVELSRLTI